MAKKTSSEETIVEPQNDVPADTQVDPQVDAQAREQTGQQQVRLRVDSREMSTGYANAFRTHGTAEEVIIDFGLNMVTQSPNQNGGAGAGAGAAATGQDAGAAGGEILFKLNDRVVMNYYSAKRLAITLGQIIRRHEDQFGELKLNVAERGTQR